MFKTNLPLYEEAGAEGAQGGGGAAETAVAQPLTIEAITALFDTKLNGALNGLDKKWGKQFKTIEDRLVAPPAAPRVEDPPIDPVVDPAKPRPDPAVSRLERQLAELKAENEQTKLAAADKEQKAAEKERQTSIRAALTKYPMAIPENQEDAFRFFRDEIKRDDDGTLLGPDDTPFEEYIDATMKTRKAYWLAVEDKSGAGAKPGSKRGNASIQIEDIKPGMAKDKLDAAAREIARMYQAAQSGG